MQYPKHVAIIPDGNRTRATENQVDIQEAYMLSYQRAVEIVAHTFTQTNIQVCTIRGLSTENTQNRPPEEFDFLMKMYKLVDDDLDRILIENQVNFKWIGNPDGITADFKEYLDQKIQKCKCDSEKYFIFAVNYWWRDEILRAIKKIVKQGMIEQINESLLSSAMDLWTLPNIDLVIRTKWDQAQRTSGFMSWRIGYAELYFTTVKCPDFSVSEYQKALMRFDSIAAARNFGK
jgi:undecaprenyl diphosphate synthase